MPKRRSIRALTPEQIAAIVARAGCAEQLAGACKAAADFYDRLALSPLDAAAKYGPDYEPPTDVDCLEVRGELDVALSAWGVAEGQSWRG